MDNQYLEKELSGKSIRPTAVRLRVLNQFRSDIVAVSLNELENVLKPIDRSTLFRTLKTFEKSGIIHTVNEDNGTIKYALCAESCSCSYTDHLHVHFSCQACLKTYCLHDTPIPDVNLPDGFGFPESRLSTGSTLHGLCDWVVGWGINSRICLPMRPKTVPFKM